MKTKIIKYISLEEKFMGKILKALDKYKDAKLLEKIKTIR